MRLTLFLTLLSGDIISMACRIKTPFGQAALGETITNYEHIYIEKPGEKDNQDDALILSQFVCRSLKERREERKAAAVVEKQYVPPRQRAPPQDSDWKATTTCIRLGNLSYSVTTDQDLLESGLLHGFRCRKVRVLSRSSMAFITLPSHQDALDLIERLNGRRYDSVVLEAELAKPFVRIGEKN